MDVDLNKEIIEKLLSIDIHCKTNMSDERVLHFTDFKNEKDSTITYKSSDWKSNPAKQIIITIKCDGYNINVD